MKSRINMVAPEGALGLRISEERVRKDRAGKERKHERTMQYRNERGSDIKIEVSVE